MEANLKLFKALPIKNNVKKSNAELMKKTLQYGFMFSPLVIGNYSVKELEGLIPIVEDITGFSSAKLNNSFHKSWEKIKEADIEQLIVEQIIHYITTYGFERLGLFDKSTVYIPKEKLNLPTINVDKIPVVIINGYTKKELKEKLLVSLNSGIALKEETIKSVVDVATWLEIEEKDVSSIKNKEVRVMLFDYLDIFPSNSTEFLRYMIYKSTNKTLIIKNTALIKEIKSRDNLNVLSLLIKYESKYGYEKLAIIFLRFKPIFLAFRTNRKLKTIVNRIRKLAIKHHKPMPVDYLNNVTAIIKKGEDINDERLKRKLSHVNIFRKIRLAYALKFRTTDCESILYRIRNGKSYAKEFEFNKSVNVKKVLRVVINSIVSDLKPQVEGKKIFIPSEIVYALPATEKQFIGELPSGSYVSLPKDIVFGVHWNNVEGHRIDLDLSLIDSSGNKYGWDDEYRDGGGSILFSGDMTDAPKPLGASELFYINHKNNFNGIMYVNYYNYGVEIKVPFKIVVAHQIVQRMKKNYMIDPNKIVCMANSVIDVKQKILGVVTTDEDECRFYFVEAGLGKNITASDSDNLTASDSGNTIHARNYIIDYYKNSINLNELLKKAGAKLVKSLSACDIDLSPEKLDKNTILKLLVK